MIAKIRVGMILILLLLWTVPVIADSNIQEGFGNHHPDGNAGCPFRSDDTGFFDTLPEGRATDPADASTGPYLSNLEYKNGRRQAYPGHEVPGGEGSMDGSGKNDLQEQPV